MPNSVKVTVPATTANIGPGFDCLGAALTLYNQFQFTLLEAPAGTVKVDVTGTEAGRVTTDSSNLAYKAFVQAYEKLQQPVPALNIAIQLGVPLARGLGSSSTAIVGGLLGANHLAGQPFSPADLVALATEIEGHPDNVVPALVGGCQLAAASESGQWILSEVPWHPDIVPVVAIPDFELSTEAARSVLPQSYSRADAIFNMAHLGLLLRGLATGDGAWLREALCDRIHQPYRKALIPGYDKVTAAALAAGAHGLVISGAGPTLLALTPPDQAAAVQQTMQAAWTAAPAAVSVHILALDTAGARVEHL
ncbi:homoserine kinase [Pseudanabaena sp. FACHB-2040]|uniref:homoserine kinase n=1 Tax=Pseudanabaena sp. FACHB-2040 TaxID=2692859 RepID=UPI0018EFA9ED|nr:homoserine kinase [Pseudanabaena sp. FACHB-2040]